MAYYLVKYLLKIGLFFYYKKIYTYGLDHIPKKEPVIFACNHPNAFMDGMILSTVSNRKLHFLARGDVFNAGWKRFFLDILHQVPIYRQQEGVENLQKNQDTFRKCYQILDKKGTILIFSEGVCIQEKRLRPLKKGTARIAFGATLNTITDYNIHIVPVNINYTYPALAKSEVMIAFGKPIHLKDYEQLHRENSPLAINTLTVDLQKRLKENLIIIEDKAREELAEKLLFLGRIAYRQINLSTKANRLNFEQNICHYVNTLPEQEYLLLKEKIDKQLLDSKGEKIPTIPSVYIGQNIISFILFPFLLIGYIINSAPLSLALYLTKKQVKNVEFHSSVHFAILLFLFPIHLIILQIIFHLTIDRLLPTYIYHENIILFSLLLYSLVAAKYSIYTKTVLFKIKYSTYFKSNFIAELFQKFNI